MPKGIGLTRFAERTFTSNGTTVYRDGPVSGSIHTIVIPIELAANAGTYTYTVDLPAGYSVELTDATFRATGITATPDITIGDTAAGTQVVASVTAATDLGALTIKDGTIEAGGLISIVVAATDSEVVTNGVLTLVGYTTNPPTSIPPRPE